MSAQAQLGHYPQTERLPDPMMSKQAVKARIAKANLLREKWRPWAQQHQDILKAMLRANSNDQAALMQVWNELPPRDNVSFRDKNFPQETLKSEREGGDATYTWQPFAKLLLIAVPRNQTPQAKDELEQKKQQIMPRIQKQFAERRDIELAKSQNSGDTTYSLWASGRITKEQTVPNKDKRRGQSAFVQEVHEVTPPYDFLQ